MWFQPASEVERGLDLSSEKPPLKELRVLLDMSGGIPSPGKRWIKLLDSIYEMGSGAGNWSEPIRMIAESLGAARAVLRFTKQDGFVASPDDHWVDIGISGKDADIYFREFVDVNPRESLIMRQRAGGLVVDGRDLPFPEIDASYIWNEFYRPRGWGYVASGVLHFSGPRPAHLSLLQEPDGRGYTEDQVDALGVLVRHLSRAVFMNNQLTDARGLHTGLSDMVDRLPTAVVLVDDKCKIISANYLANLMIARQDGPLKVSGGFLSAARLSKAAVLQKLVQEALSSARKSGVLPPAVLRLTYLKGSGVLSVLAIPVAETVRSGSATSGSVILYLSDPGMSRRLNVSLLEQEFGFTSSEAHVAALMCEGASIEQIAAVRRVSRETVRVQVKSLLHKSQVHGQVELVLRLRGSLASLHLKDHRF